MCPSFNRLTAASLLITALLSASVVVAGPSQAEALVEQGIELRRQRRDPEAIEAFAKAYALSPSPRVRAQLGLARQAVALWIDAEHDLAAALASNDPWIAQHRMAIAESLNAVRQHLASVRISSNVPNAELSINGARLGAVPIEPVRVAAGPVVVMVDAPGHKRATRSVLVPPDTVANVGVNLEPEPVVPTDGASAPVATLPPPPEERPAPQPIAPVVSPSDGRRTRAWVLAAAGGVLLVEAVAAQITAEVLMSKYNDDTRCVYGTLTRDDRCGHYRHEADALRTAAVVGYGVGGVAAVVAAYLFATSSVKVTAGPAAGWGATVVTAW